MHPHKCRRVIRADGMRFNATTPADLDAAVAECQGQGGKVVDYLIHRQTDGSDGPEEVVREYRVA